MKNAAEQIHKEMLASVLIRHARKKLPIRAAIWQDWILRMGRFSRRKRPLGRKMNWKTVMRRREMRNETVSNDGMEHGIIVVALGRPRRSRS